jgi:predicted metal-dependent TIM-barrel fold hydrolase
MPTHDSEHEVDYNKETRAKAIVSHNGKLIPEVFEVLDLIKERNLTLATGHVTPEEALMIMAEAKKRGITRIIVTHPLLGEQFTNMSLPQLQESVKLGGAIEITAGTVSRDGPAKTRAIEVIKALGTQNVFVSSDSGLVGTPNHPDALAMAAKSLRTAGFTEQNLNRMFKETPARLVGL